MLFSYESFFVSLIFRPSQGLWEVKKNLSSPTTLYLRHIKTNPWGPINIPCCFVLLCLWTWRSLSLDCSPWPIAQWTFITLCLCEGFLHSLKSVVLWVFGASLCCCVPLVSWLVCTSLTTCPENKDAEGKDNVLLTSISNQCGISWALNRAYGLDEWLNELKQVYFVGEHKNHFNFLFYKRLIPSFFLFQSLNGWNSTYYSNLTEIPFPSLPFPSWPSRPIPAPLLFCFLYSNQSAALALVFPSWTSRFLLTSSNPVWYLVYLCTYLSSLLECGFLWGQVHDFINFKILSAQYPGGVHKC